MILSVWLAFLAVSQDETVDLVAFDEETVASTPGEAADDDQTEVFEIKEAYEISTASSESETISDTIDDNNNDDTQSESSTAEESSDNNVVEATSSSEATGEPSDDTDADATSSSEAADETADESSNPSTVSDQTDDSSSVSWNPEATEAPGIQIVGNNNSVSASSYFTPNQQAEGGPYLSGIYFWLITSSIILVVAAIVVCSVVAYNRRSRVQYDRSMNARLTA